MLLRGVESREYVGGLSGRRQQGVMLYAQIVRTRGPNGPIAFVSCDSFLQNFSWTERVESDVHREHKRSVFDDVTFLAQKFFLSH